MVSTTAKTSTKPRLFHNLDRSTGFLDMLRGTANKRHDEIFATWYDINGDVEDERTFGEIWDEAGFIAAHLHYECGLSKGQRVVLCFDFGLHFYAAFLGCLRAGIVATLVYPPGPPLQKSLTKLNLVIDDCKPSMILTDHKISLLRMADTCNPLSKTRHMWPKHVNFLITDTLYTPTRTSNTHNKSILSGLYKQVSTLTTIHKDAARRTLYDDPSIAPSDLAFIQYTSGSTGNPKGVLVTFGNVAANVNLNLQAIYQCYYEDIGSVPDRIVGFSWLPQYHDMGLIYGTTVPFVDGFRQHMISPTTFIKNPLLWMELMSKHRVNMGVAPDFAYRLVVRKFQEAHKRNPDCEPIPDLDLSHMQYLSNAAEPVRKDTYTQFGGLFANYGLRSKYHVVALGMAEHVATLCYVHGHIPHDLGTSCPVAVGSRHTFDPCLDIRIVDPSSMEEQYDGNIGEVWISSPSVASGYYGKPELSQEVFHASIKGYHNDSNQEYLRSGDLGFFDRNGRLFLCGRIKDLIIIGGVNYYPQDVEAAVQRASEAVRPGCVAAFSKDEGDQDGELEIVFEIRKSSEAEAQVVCSTIQTAVLSNIGVIPSHIVAIAERTICKTTSGKIQRKATRTKLHQNGFHIVMDSMVDRNRVAGGSPRPANAPTFDEEKTDAVEAFDQIMHQFFGQDCDQTASWETLGMTSMAGVGFKSAVQDSFPGTVLPNNCFEIYATPNELRTFVLKPQGIPLEKKTTMPAAVPETGILSEQLLFVLQFFGILLHLLAIGINAAPAYHAVKWASGDGKFSETVLVGSAEDSAVAKWLWFPIAIPIWMCSYSLLLIILKWLLIGQYKEKVLSTSSWEYLRWWWMDRALHFWEQWIGMTVLGTPYLWLFYFFMGAKIHISARLGTFVREFDLVTICKQAWLKETACVNCRFFTPDHHLSFRRVEVGKKSEVAGMLCSGSEIGEGVIVEPRSVIQEDCKVPSNVLVTGNPAVNMGSFSEELQRTQASYWKIYVLTSIWSLVTLYMLFALAFVVQLGLSNLPFTFLPRFSKLFFWIATVAGTVFLLLPVNIILKWILIGKRRPGPFTENAWQVSCDWVVDFHFKLFFKVVDLVFHHSWGLWQIVLTLYGMDIDRDSQMGSAVQTPPSKMDLIHLSKAHISSNLVHFGTHRGNEYLPIKLQECSIGGLVALGPGVEVKRTAVQPSTFVSMDLIGSERIRPLRYKSIWGMLLYHFLVLCWIVVVVVSLIPSFEVVNKTVSNKMGAGLISLALSAAFGLHLTISCLGFIIISWICYPSPKQKTVWSFAVFNVAFTAAAAVQFHSLWILLYGTELWSTVIKFAGAEIQGRVLNFGHFVSGPAYHTYHDGTIVDGATIIEHRFVGESLICDELVVGGVVNEGIYVVGGTQIPVSTTITGPFRCVATQQTHKENQLDCSTSEDDTPL